MLCALGASLVLTGCGSTPDNGTRGGSQPASGGGAASAPAAASVVTSAASPGPGSVRAGRPEAAVPSASGSSMVNADASSLAKWVGQYTAVGRLRGHANGITETRPVPDVFSVAFYPDTQSLMIFGDYGEAAVGLRFQVDAADRLKALYALVPSADMKGTTTFPLLIDRPFAWLGEASGQAETGIDSGRYRLDASSAPSAWQFRVTPASHPPAYKWLVDSTLTMQASGRHAPWDTLKVSAVTHASQGDVDLQVTLTRRS